MSLLNTSIENETNSLEFSIIKELKIRNKIIKEIDLLHKKYKNKLIVMSINDKIDGTYSITICQLSDDDNSNIFYDITFTNNYPYIPCQLYLNKKLYSQLIFENNNVYKFKQIQELFKKSILFSENWKITSSFVDIIDEVYKFENCYKQILYRICFIITKKIQINIEFICSNILKWL